MNSRPEPYDVYGYPEESLSITDMAVADGSHALVQRLEGGWFRKSDGTAVGEVFAGHIIWNKAWDMELEWSKVQEVGSSMVQIEVQGRCYVGVTCFDAQCTITWNDGDVWVMK